MNASKKVSKVTLALTRKQKAQLEPLYQEVFDNPQALVIVGQFWIDEVIVRCLTTKELIESIKNAKPAQP